MATSLNSQKYERDWYHKRNTAWRAFESAAAQLQRDCPGFEIAEGSRDYSGCDPTRGDDCPVCHGTGKVGITALELAEALKDGGIAELIEALKAVRQIRVMDLYVAHAHDRCPVCSNFVHMLKYVEPDLHEPNCPFKLLDEVLAKLQPKEAT